MDSATTHSFERQASAYLSLPTDPGLLDQWHLIDVWAGIGAYFVWPEYQGAGIRVGVMDDGVDYRHPDLAANYDPACDYDGETGAPNGGPRTTSDAHGTMVAGVIAADDNGSGLVGVAPDATITSFRINLSGSGPLWSDTNSMSSALKHADLDVLNCSWGYSQRYLDDLNDPSWAPVRQVFEQLVSEGRDGLGTVIVFAAGNDRQQGANVNDHGLETSPWTIAVGAVDEYGLYADFSTPGAALLVSAPGVDILTTERGGSHGAVDGTSFAAPAVSGVVALMLDANEGLGYRDVQEILAYSARPMDFFTPGWQMNGATNWNGSGLHFSHDYGFGIVDAAGAVRLAESWTRQNDLLGREAGVYDNVVGATRSTAPWTPIPDAFWNPGVITSTIQITEAIEVDQVQVTLAIDHTCIGDLTVVLTSPYGTESVLVDRPGLAPGSYGNGDESDQIRFTMSSTAHWGELATGTWTLTVTDHAGFDVGTLEAWSLTVLGDAASANDAYIYTDDYGIFTNADQLALTDAGGTDVVNVAAVVLGVNLDLAPGASGTLCGETFRVAPGTIIEHAIGSAGNDILRMNDVANTVYGGDGADVVRGRGGADVLDGGDGDDQLLGDAGADRLLGQAGRDLLKGGLDGDTLLGGSHADRLYGGDGNDTARGGDHADFLYGENGNDLLYGQAGADKLYGNAGADMLDGGPDGDVLYGGDENDRLYGQAGVDKLYGEAGADRLYGGSGDDFLSGSAGADRLIGDDGADRLDGGTHDDVLDGGLHNDHLYGGDGNDQLRGGSGNDRLEGGSGADRLEGSIGNDVMIGGFGRDTFVLRSNSGDDVIRDFATGDRLLFDGVARSSVDLARSGSDTLVSWNDGSVLLLDLAPSQVSMSDFLFA